jgi:20S proteasome alpha/beta subunit
MSTNYLRLHCFFLLVLLSRASTSKAPWQSANSGGDVRQEALYADLPPTVFAPGGRLYSVETALRDVHNPLNPSSNLVVAIKCKEGVVVVTTLPQSPYIYNHVRNETDTTSTNATSTTDESDKVSDESPQVNSSSLLWSDYCTTPFVQLDRHIWGVSAGQAVEGQLLRRHRLLDAAEQARRTSGNVQVGILARNVADAHQAQTQKASKGRLVACACLLMDTTTLWRVDPNGQFWKCHAAVVGRAATVQMEHDLLGRLKNISSENLTTTKEEALVAATQTIQDAWTRITTTKNPQAALEGVQLRGMVLEENAQYFVSHEDLVGMIQQDKSE